MFWQLKTVVRILFVTIRLHTLSIKSMHWFFSYLTSFIFKTLEFLSKLIAFYFVRKKRSKGHFKVGIMSLANFSSSKESKIRKVGSSPPSWKQLFQALGHGLFLQLMFGSLWHETICILPSYYLIGIQSIFNDAMVHSFVAAQEFLWENYRLPGFLDQRNISDSFLNLFIFQLWENCNFPLMSKDR